MKLCRILRFSCEASGGFLIGTFCLLWFPSSARIVQKPEIQIDSRDGHKHSVEASSRPGGGGTLGSLTKTGALRAIEAPLSIRITAKDWQSANFSALRPIAGSSASNLNSFAFSKPLVELLLLSGDEISQVSELLSKLSTQMESFTASHNPPHELPATSGLSHSAVTRFEINGDPAGAVDLEKQFETDLRELLGSDRGSFLLLKLRADLALHPIIRDFGRNPVTVTFSQPQVGHEYIIVERVQGGARQVSQTAFTYDELPTRYSVLFDTNEF